MCRHTMNQIANFLNEFLFSNNLKSISRLSLWVCLNSVHNGFLLFSAGKGFNVALGDTVASFCPCTEFIFPLFSLSLC